MQEISKKSSISKMDDIIEKKLLKAEQQIEDGKTVEASKVFEELEKQFGF